MKEGRRGSEEVGRMGLEIAIGVELHDKSAVNRTWIRMWQTNPKSCQRLREYCSGFCAHSATSRLISS